MSVALSDLLHLVKENRHATCVGGVDFYTKDRVKNEQNCLEKVLVSSPLNTCIRRCSGISSMSLLSGVCSFP